MMEDPHAIQMRRFRLGSWDLHPSTAYRPGAAYLCLPGDGAMSGPAKSWLRMYTDFIYNRKIIRLPEHLQLILVKFWCLNRAGHFSGATTSDIAFELRTTEEDVSESIAALKVAGLIDENGDIHDWELHQFESDSSTDRVKRFRQRSMKRSNKKKRNVSETADGTDRAEQSRAEHNRAEQTRDDSPVIGTILLKDGSTFAFTEKMAEPWPAAFPGIDIKREIAKAGVWCIDHPEKRKTRRGAMAFMSGWLGRADPSPPPRKPQRPDLDDDLDEYARKRDLELAAIRAEDAARART